MLALGALPVFVGSPSGCCAEQSKSTLKGKIEMNRKLHTLFLMMLMAGIMLSASVARADLLLTLDNPTQGGSQGQTLFFSGTLTATSNIQSIDGDDCNIAGPITCDDSPFLANALLSMVAGDVYSGLLFTLSLGANVPYNQYNGFFAVDWTDAAGVSQRTDPGPTGNFSATVPEPASMLLLGSGLSGLVGV